MKFLIASLALMQVSAYRLRYAESEGPTKADNGESDEVVLGQDAKWLKDHWTNPLDWKDDGSDDDTVLTMLVGTLVHPTTILGKIGRRKIYDADGDGVEDNVKHDQYTLDKFRKMVFSPAVEDIHNTRNGELPGHHRWGDHPEPGVNIHAEAEAKEAKAKADKAAEEKKQAEAAKKSFLQTD